MAHSRPPRVSICNVANGKGEDRYSETSLERNGTGMNVVGVYDGHGGKVCAEYISTALPREFERRLAEDGNTGMEKHLVDAFREVDTNIVNGLHDNFKSYVTLPMPRVLRQKGIESKLRQTEIRDIVLRARSGATALVAVIDDKSVTLANVGDCRAVLGHVNPATGVIEAKALTLDQNGSDEAERKRILHEHPASEAETLIVGGRLFGHTSVTRSFGDVFFKEPHTGYAEHVFSSPAVTSRDRLPFHENMKRFYYLVKTPPYLTAVPEVTQHQRTPGDVFLVIASDGVWGLEAATNEWVVRTVQEGLGKGQDPARYLMDKLADFHPGDDVTVIVVEFSV